MLCLALLSVLALAHGAALDKRGFNALDAVSLKSFTDLFRQTLLNKVAVEWNATVDMTAALKIKMDACEVKIKAQSASCTTCAKSACQASPSFTDYLNLANPYTYLEGPLKDMASKFSDAASMLGGKASGFFTSMQDMAGSTTGAVGDGFSSALHAVTDGLGQVGDFFTDGASSVIDTANLVGNTLTDGLGTIGDGLSGAAHEVEHIGSSIGHAIGSIFGKKREIDAATRKCMEQCSACRPLLLTDQQQMISTVCGADVITLNNTIQARAKQIKGVYDAALDKTHAIITKLEFDPASMNGMMQLSNVQVTVMLNGASQTYKTSVPYAMMNMPDTARQMALEYWSKSQ